MYDYDAMMSREGAPSLLSSPADPLTGYWDDITEIYVPLGQYGFGDYMTNTNYGGPAPLVDIEVTSKSDTVGCAVELLDVAWLDDTNAWHAVDVVISGYYGTPPAGPRYMSGSGIIPLNDPVSTLWHELYPRYCNWLEIVDWTDNGDGYLSASDQIEMLNQTDGWIYPYHVDTVTTTIHWTFKDIPVTEELGDAEPDDEQKTEDIMNNPVGSSWHEIYPVYCKQFKIVDWVDNGDGVFGPSDQFAILYEEGFTGGFPPPGPGPYWAHLDSITVDIVVSPKGDPWPPSPEFPLGLTLMIAIAPAIPLAFLWRLRKKEVAK
jgi:hypothetical protein